MTQKRTFQTSLLRSKLLLLFFALIALTSVQSIVIGFDFGSTFFKITLVKPGQPFSIVENVATKRKTETMLTLPQTDEGRIFGADSYQEQSKHIKTSFHNLHRFVGMRADAPELPEILRERYIMNEVTEDERGYVAWKIQRHLYSNGSDPVEEIIYTEELIGQLFKHGKQMSEKQAGVTSIKDCVITIPSYYTYAQRRMINDAADIAGLTVLQLVHENTAAATMFGIDRMDRDKPMIVLFYNLGGMDTEVSLVRYSTITEMPANKTYEHVEIIGEAYDKELGGAEFDKILINMLAERFNALKERQGKPDVRTFPKVLKRLLKEVVKIKDILSANKQVQVKLGELQDYVTLSTVVERKDFEEKAQVYFDRVIKPVEEVLEKAGLTIDQIDMIELLGGGIRIPRIQEILQEKTGKQELGVHLNGDEAMCFGAAFIASNSSASFKVRKVYLTQHPQQAISIRISPANESKIISQQTNEEEQESVASVVESTEEDPSQANAGQTNYYRTYQLYKLSDYLGQKKSLSLNYDTNMKIEVYTGEGSLEEGDHLATFTISGLDEIASSELLKKENVTRPRVSLSFELNRSGLIQLNKAEAKVEETYLVDAPIPKSKKLNVTKATNDSSSSEDNSTETIDTSADEPAKPEKILKKRTIPYPLNRIERVFRGALTLTREQIQSSKDRIRWYERKDEERMRTDKAKNDFESVIYSMRDWLGEYSHSRFIGGSDKVDEYTAQLSAAEEWLLDGEGEHATYVEYSEKYNELNGIFEKLKLRKDEHAKRPEAVRVAKRRLAEITDEINDLAEKKPWINETQRQDVLDRVADIRKWVDEQVSKQADLQPDEDPVFRTSDLEIKITRANALLTRLASILKPKEKKKKMPKNFKIDNMTFNGKDGENINIEDFIKFDNGGYDDTEDEIPQQQQKQEEKSNEEEQQSSNKQEEDPQHESSTNSEEKSSTSETSEEL